MREQRLIDANSLKACIDKEERSTGYSEVYDIGISDGLMAAAEIVDEQPTIDPESLPIVQELREKLEFYENLPNEGDPLYLIVQTENFRRKIRKVRVNEVVKTKDGWYVAYWYLHIRRLIPTSAIGKSLFRTREEAEIPLKEREE